MASVDLRHTVTRLLVASRSGNAEAVNELMPIVYDELRRLARRYMSAERVDHTLQHTALVHEAYVQLVGMDIQWNDRAHFFAVAARSMRRILVDHARTKGREKRGGDLHRVPFEDVVPTALQSPSADILDLDDALLHLASVDKRQSEILELHYFGGMNHEEIAEVVGVSAATVDRDLRMARAWMNRELRGEGQLPTTQ